MNQIDPLATRPANSKPALHPSAKRILWIALGLAAVLLWATAIWVTYVGLPPTRKLLKDFKSPIDPITIAAVLYAGRALPVLGVIGLVVGMLTNSRWAWHFVLIWLPLIAAAGLFWISLSIVHRLVEAVGN